MADLLNIGRTGLNSSKKSLETTGHNIANANTEGFSRQRVTQTSNVPIHRSGLIQGTGSRVVGVNRVHDKFIENQLDSAVTKNEYYKSRTDNLAQIEDVFNEINNDGLNKVLNKFYNSFRELANQPESEIIRSVVRDNAQLVAKDFKRIGEALNNITRSIDNRLTLEVESINQDLKTISNLNKKIADLEAVGGETADLRDQRDLSVKNLSKSFKVSTYFDEKGNYVLSADNVGTLVSAGHAQFLKVGSGNKNETGSSIDGSIEIYFQNRPAKPITSNFVGGNVKSLVAVRSGDIKNLKDNIDTIAYEFINTTNAIHRKGFVHRPIEMNIEGTPVMFDAKGPVTDIDFFKPVEREDAALKLDLSDLVKADLTNITTGLEPNSPGDNRIALAISKLQHEKFMQNGSATIEEQFLQSIGKIGVETSKAKLDTEQSEGVLSQITSIKERVSGVSLDEETANMVRYQHAYEASAKVMQSANEMFDTVLSIKR